MGGPSSSSDEEEFLEGKWNAGAGEVTIKKKHFKNEYEVTGVVANGLLKKARKTFEVSGWWTGTATLEGARGHKTINFSDGSVWHKVGR